jgi:uridine kinase
MDTIKRPCKIELLDMRTHVGRMVYQHGMIMIYLKALEEVLGRQEVEVQHALSKGLYTEINGGEEISDEDLDKIREHMNAIVEKDMPFIKVTADRKSYEMELEWAGLTEKKRLMEQQKDVNEFVFYSLEGFNNFFYGHMPPSTSYIAGCDIRRYRRGVLLVLPEKRAGSGLQYIDDRKLYSAFMQTKKWQKLLGINYVLDLDNKVRGG